MVKSLEQEETRRKILNAALDEFILKGKDGARMQAIADRAGVNKAMLHYYFTSKDQLHKTVVETLFRKALKSILGTIIDKQISGIEFIRRFVHGYFTFLRDNPEFPRLLLWEIASDNEEFTYRLKEFLQTTSPPIPETGVKIIQMSVERGEIYPYDPHQLIISILGMVLFYFIGRPVIRAVFDQGIDEPEFLEKREEHIQTLIMRAISPQQKERD